MRITTLEIKTFPPLIQFSVESLSDTVVIGGPNGVGKTRLQEAILQKFRNAAGNPNIRLVVEATTDSEIAAWGARRTLDTSNPAEASLLGTYCQRPQKRGQLRSGVLNFDSSRTFEEVRPYSFSWDFADPFEENIGWEASYNPFRSRFTDVVNSLHRKLRSQKEEIARKALELNRQGAESMPLGLADPLQKFKKAFSQLLPGKELVDLDERDQAIKYRTSGSPQPLPLQRLSSGEREVVGIVFDFLLRDPADCVVVFDEPELHLHPELSYRLLHTLREAGERNQFLFCTHSADIITSSLENTVIFVRPPKGDTNQALVLKQDSEAAHVLHLLGQSLGIIALGRRLVLIEGEHTSLDKQTYGAILGSKYPDLVLVPAGGRESLETFARAIETVLNRTVWGVDFFVLCDGDASVSRARSAQIEKETAGRLRRLGRYHLENYFLDAQVLAKVFEHVGDPSESWLRSPEQIDKRLRELAKPVVSYGAALRVAHALRLASGSVDALPKECNGKSLEELTSLFDDRVGQEARRIASSLDTGEMHRLLEAEYRAIEDALGKEGDEWKRLIPGRPILHSFAQAAKMDVARLKALYLKVAKDHVADPFSEIRGIFEAFAKYDPSSRQPTA